MQSITTKYHGATNFKGSHVSATASGGARVMISYDDALSTDGNHDAAAAALVKKLKWDPATLIRGGAPKGRGNVYVMLSNSCGDDKLIIE